MVRRYYFSKTGLIVNSIVFFVFMVTVLPYMASLTESMTHTAFSPDTATVYTPERFYESMALYGDAGRDFYILSRWTFDIAWPIVYAGFFISVIAHLSSGLTRKWRTVAFPLPLLAVAFDLLENTLATANVGLYPRRSLFLLRLMQGASILKWGCILLTVSVIVVLSVCHIQRRIRSTDKVRD